MTQQCFQKKFDFFLTPKKWKNGPQKLLEISQDPSISQSNPDHSSTEKGQRKFWEWLISMICLCSKYVKICNIFGQILNIWVILILWKKF